MKNVVVQQMPREGIRVLLEATEPFIVDSPDKTRRMGLTNAHDPLHVSEQLRSLLGKFMRIDGREGGE